MVSKFGASAVRQTRSISGAMRFTDACRLSHPVSELELIGTRDAIPINGSARLLSAAQVAARWRKLDGCSSQLGTAVIGSAQARSWNHCHGGSGVALYVIKGGTHGDVHFEHASGHVAGVKYFQR